MGHPATKPFAPLVDEAESRAFLVTSMTVQLLGLQEKYGSNGFGYVGAINYSAGYALGKEAAKALVWFPGDKALSGVCGSTGRPGERTRVLLMRLKKPASK
jgi:simple sugar transport system substrate-binding protein